MAPLPEWPVGGFPQPTTPPPTSLPVSNGYMGTPHIGRNFNCYTGSGESWSDPEGGHEPWLDRSEYCDTLSDGKVLGCNFIGGVGATPQGLVLSPALTLNYDAWIVTFNCWRLSTSPYSSGAYLQFTLIFQDGTDLLSYQSAEFDISGTNITNIPTTYTTSIDTSGVGNITTNEADEANLLKIDLNPLSYNGYFFLDYIAVTPDTPPTPTITNHTYTALDLNYHPRHLGS